MSCLPLCLVLVLSACRAETPPTFLEQRLESLNTIDKASLQIPVDDARVGALEAAYNVLFAPFHDREALDTLDDHDLDLLFQAKQTIAFYAKGKSHVMDMLSLLQRLEQRHLATTRHYELVYGELVRARMLDDARDLTRRHPSPELEPLPEIRDGPGLVAGQPTAWTVAPDGRELVRQSVDLHEPAHVVIVSHPLCHFSQDASEAIEADPALAAIFRAHATWLAPQDGRLNFDRFQAWNREHAGQRMTIAYQRDEWPIIDSWGTPTFYFLQNGVVRAKVTGWPKEGRRAELVAALGQIGLM